MWQATLIFHPHKNMFPDLSNFSSHYNSTIYMFYTCVSYKIIKKILW